MGQQKPGIDAIALGFFHPILHVQPVKPDIAQPGLAGHLARKVQLDFILSYRWRERAFVRSTMCFINSSWSSNRPAAGRVFFYLRWLAAAIG